ncbi:MAG: HIT family protein [Lachnospiraceae bacterium]|nr:HIT family protein [Lachnospiraceae bacterium]
MRKDDCIFCKIANGEIPSNTVYEDEDFRAILDMGPAAKGHTLLLPKEHADNLFELPDETAEKALKVAKCIGKKLMSKLGADGMNIVQNNGEIAGQTVMHFHIHIIPRYKDDNQKIGWVPGKPTAEELLETCKQINA